MAIAKHFFVDYQNKLVVHAQVTVYYTTPGTGGFTVGETVTWPTSQSAVVVGEDTTNDILWLVYNTAATPSGLITGGSSGATCTVSATSNLDRATFSYDTGTGGWTTGARITIGTATATVVSDDTTNDILVVEDINGTISDNDAISGGAGGELVNGVATIQQRTYTARELYSFMQDTFDDLDQMDDTVPMSAQTPTEFTMINGWFIDDASIKYLTGGAISTSGYDNEIWVVPFSGTYTPAVPSDIGLAVLGGTTGDTGTLLHYDNTNSKWWVRSTITNAFDTVETVQVTTAGGTGTGTTSAAAATGEDLYANIYTLGTIATDPNPKTYIFQNSSALSEWWGRGDSSSHIDVLIKVQEADTAIDGYDITVFARHFGDSYDHFTIDLTSGGRNAVPLATATDLNNNTTGEITLAYSSGSGTWTVGQFVRDNSTGAYAEILDDTTGVLTVGNVIEGSGGDFTAAVGVLRESSDGIYNDGDASADLDTVTSVVRGYNNIGIYFVNVQIDYESGGTTTPTLYETVTGATSGATGVLMSYTTTAGTWAGGDAAGVMTLGNWNSTTWGSAELLNGSTSGANFAQAKVTTGETVVSTINKNFEQGSSYPYNVIVEMAGRTMAQVYEWFKYVTREDANSTALGAYNHITMYRVDTGAVVEEDGEEYISAVTTYPPVKASPFGTLAGGKLFGARGVWLENMATADRQNFQLIDANGTTQVPPNFQTITVNSVASGDNVSVFRTSTGTTIDRALYTSTAANTSGETSFVVSTAISSDTPNSGFIRVVDTSDTSINRETRYAYSSWTTSTFTLSGSTTLDRTYTTDDTAYVPYYDEQALDTSVSVTVIYTADRTVLTRVRRYNGAGDSILPFQVTGTFGSTGYTAAAIRTDDTIVT